MTREEFIRKWLGNPEKPYTEANRNEIREDLDLIIEISNKSRCRTYFPDTSTTASAKCRFCGREQWEH